ncbi:hypothetical protein [Pandoraea sputorum]|uniref:hypothetical protein n=1 Tax=Pandoraea sputorum TaxID=93222 RepID=UPI00123FCC3D|nr:hypothetical protein [Pandoraea sputorum]
MTAPKCAFKGPQECGFCVDFATLFSRSRISAKVISIHRNTDVDAPKFAERLHSVRRVLSGRFVKTHRKRSAATGVPRDSGASPSPAAASRAQFVRDAPARASTPLEQAAYKPLGSGRAFWRLFAVDRHDDLVKMARGVAPR